MKPVLRSLCILILLQALEMGIRASDSDLGPLPEWTQADYSALFGDETGRPILGGLLWPRGVEGGLNVDVNGILPEIEIRKPGDMAPLADSPDQAQPKADLGNFLPPIQHAAMESAEEEVLPAAPKPTPLSELRELDAGFIENCYAADPGTFIIDPAYHLSELEREDMERFLSYHARDAKIRAYALIIGKNEKVTSDLDLAKLSGGTLLKDNTCLLVLPIGEPWRARLFFTSNIHQSAKPAALTELMADCIRDGQSQSQPSEQVHRMLVRLSIRLFWLQNELSPTSPPAFLTAAERPTTRPDAKPPIPLLKKPVVMSEVVSAPKPTLLQRWQESTGLDLRLVAIGLSVLSVLALSWIRWHRYKLRHYEWMLPDSAQPGEERLGGAFSGGGGAWLAYR